MLVNLTDCYEAEWMLIEEMMELRMYKVSFDLTVHQATEKRKRMKR